jgi:TRAP-type C4-dicarboxylate transport system substrate-binding protein
MQINNISKTNPNHNTNFQGKWINSTTWQRISSKNQYCADPAFDKFRLKKVEQLKPYIKTLEQKCPEDLRYEISESNLSYHLLRNGEEVSKSLKTTNNLFKILKQVKEMILNDFFNTLE